MESRSKEEKNPNHYRILANWFVFVLFLFGCENRQTQPDQGAAQIREKNSAEKSVASEKNFPVKNTQKKLGRKKTLRLKDANRLIEPLQTEAWPRTKNSYKVKKLLRKPKLLKKQVGSKLYSLPLNPRATTKKTPLFQKLDGSSLGLTRGYRFDLLDYPAPFWAGRGTAAGDYDEDGWEDIAFGSNQGIFLYKNHFGRFELQNIKSNDIKKNKVFAIAFVDLNNDGWLDLFFSTFNRGNYVLINKNGSFANTRPLEIPNGSAILTIAPAFADFDQNSFLDIYNGNMALGIFTGMKDFGVGRSNSLTLNSNMEFRERKMASPDGETLSVLASDLNGDNYVDLYEANDYLVPDRIFANNRYGHLKESFRSEDFLKFTPKFSRSADSGDLDNDLLLDLTVAGTHRHKKAKNLGKTGAYLYSVKGRLSELLNSIPNQLDTENCDGRSQTEEKRNCFLKQYWWLVTSENPNLPCRKLTRPFFAEICSILKKSRKPHVESHFSRYFQQINENLLFLAGQKSSSHFEEINFLALKKRGEVLSRSTTGTEEGRSPANTSDQNLPHNHPGGWTWNQKIFDADNDGWQDIFNSSGSLREKVPTQNTLMKNKLGKTFSPKQEEFGLISENGLYSFVTTDFDNDGDLDIIGNSSIGPVEVFVNHTPSRKNGLLVSLESKANNSFGIGAKIYISIRNERSVASEKLAYHQVREVKASGGYLSFDSARVHFGLGASTQVEAIKVVWPDRKETIFHGPFDANKEYRILREL